MATRHLEPKTREKHFCSRDRLGGKPNTVVPAVESKWDCNQWNSKGQCPRGQAYSFRHGPARKEKEETRDISPSLVQKHTPTRTASLRNDRGAPPREEQYQMRMREQGYTQSDVEKFDRASEKRKYVATPEEKSRIQRPVQGCATQPRRRQHPQDRRTP